MKPSPGVNAHYPRIALGLLTLVLIIAGGALWLFVGDVAAPIGLGMLRLAIVFGAVWLAVPNFRLISSRVPQWLLIGTVAALCIVALRPRTIFVVGPLLIAFWALAPDWLGLRRR
jgi:hypothetical protein